ERYRGSTEATAGPALVPFAVLFAGATSWLAKTGKELQDPAPTRQITAMIGWKTLLNVDLPRSEASPDDRRQRSNFNPGSSCGAPRTRKVMWLSSCQATWPAKAPSCPS